MAFSLAQTPTYDATATLRFQNLAEDVGAIGNPIATLETPAQLAAAAARGLTRTPLLDEARRSITPRPTVRELRSALDVSIDTSSNLVDVTVNDESARYAARAANTVAETAARTANQDVRSRFRGSADAIEDQLRRLRPGSEERIALAQTSSRLRSLSVVARPAELTRQADVPGSPATPKTTFNVALGLLLGAFVGVGFASLRDALDRRLRTTADVTEALDLPILGTVRDEAMGKAPYLTSKPNDVELEAQSSYSILRRTVELLRLEDPPRTIAVTSAVPEEGKTTVALSLACAFASLGRLTLLVETDLRRSQLGRRTGLKPGLPGLADYLAGQARPDEILNVVELPAGAHMTDEGNPSLVCILGGTAVGDPTDLLASERFRAFMSDVASAYDFVIVDTPPLLPVADTLELLPHVDAYILCARVGLSRRGEILAAKALVSRIPQEPAGAVITGARGRQGDGYASYYGYGYRNPGAAASRRRETSKAR